MKHIEIKKISAWVNLAVAIILLGIGIALLILNPEISVTAAIIAEAVLVFITGISEVTDSFKNGKKKEAVVRIILYLALIVFILLFSLIFLTALNLLYAIVALVLFIIRVMICIHLVKNDGKHTIILKNALAGFFCLAFGVIMLVLPPEGKIIFIVIVVGIFFILYSLNYFGDFFAAISKKDLDESKKTRRIRFSLPNLFTAGTINDAIRECDQLIKDNPNECTFVTSTGEFDPAEINFEIMVHVANTVGGSMGHIDVCVEGVSYSYGGYNEKDKILGGLFGGGTFFNAPKKPYINNCIKNSNKYIIGYGCILSDAQINAVKERINEIIGLSSELTLDEALTQGRKEDDYLLAILRMGGKVYLVKQGEYKRYFGLATNCVALANTIMGKVGFDDLSTGSLKTPGAYIHMLEEMLYRSNTKVVQKTSYLKVDE